MNQIWTAVHFYSGPDPSHIPHPHSDHIPWMMAFLDTPLLFATYGPQANLNITAYEPETQQITLWHITKQFLPDDLWSKILKPFHTCAYLCLSAYTDVTAWWLEMDSCVFGCTCTCTVETVFFFSQPSNTVVAVTTNSMADQYLEADCPARICSRHSSWHVPLHMLHFGK